MHLRSLRFSKVYVSQNYTEDATDSNNPNVNPSSPDANWENYQLRINPTDNWMVSNSPLSHLLLAPTLMHKCKVGAVVSERWLSNGNLEHTHTNIIPNVWCRYFFLVPTYLSPSLSVNKSVSQCFSLIKFFPACLRYRGRSKHWAHYPGDDSLGVR